MNSKKRYILVIAIVILCGIFLRAYNFSDWLHFELDQARDAKIAIEAAEEGIGNLPLQGPRAAGSFLRLGPAFYYLEYLGAKIFGPTPVGVASGVLIFSILTLPLFYAFARRYFNTRISLGLLAVFSTSLFLVMYSRFAWNPNLIPFFMLLAVYALLRVVDNGEKKKDLWLWIFALALGIGTQLHFLVFMILPMISAIFLLIKRPRLNILTWLGALIIVLFLYSPMIVNDVKTGGQNVKEFFAAVTDKSDKNDHSFIEKVIKNYTEHSLGHFLVISGQERAEFYKIETSFKIGKLWSAKCDDDCRQKLPLGIVAVVFFTAGLCLLVRNFFVYGKGIKKDFLVISTIWLAVSFVIMTPLSYDIAPRFFLVTAPLALVFLGLVLEFSDKILRKRWISTILVILLIMLNLMALQKRFLEMKNAPFEDVRIEPDRILKERARVTLKQQNMIVDYMTQSYRENGYPIYLQSDSFYARSFSYLLEWRKIPQDTLSVSFVYAKGNHFLIYGTAANAETRLGKYAGSYDVVEEKSFGTLTLIRLAPKKEAIIAETQNFIVKKSECKTSSAIQKRYTWNEIFGKGKCFEEDEEEVSN